MFIFILQKCVLWIQISMKLLCFTINEIWLIDQFLFDRMIISDGKKTGSFKKALKKAHRKQDLAHDFKNLADNFQVEISGSQQTQGFFHH